MLASWRDTPTRPAIVDFVETVTGEEAAGYVAPAERVAVFDNDGTLWSEKPIPIQLDFTLFRMAELAEADPSLRAASRTRRRSSATTAGSARPWSSTTTATTPTCDLLMGAVETAFGGHDGGGLQRRGHAAGCSRRPPACWAGRT